MLVSSLCTDICISCGSLNVSLEHPLFVGAMCQSCKVQHTHVHMPLKQTDRRHTINWKVNIHYQSLLWLFVY